MLIIQSYISRVAVNARLSNKITVHTLAKVTKIDNFMLIIQSYISRVAVNARLSNKITVHTLAKVTKIDNFNIKCPFSF